jgi:hypothetical protein
MEEMTMTEQTPTTTQAGETAPTGTPPEPAAVLASESEQTAQERAQRVAMQLRDCLGLDPLQPQEARDLARMSVATALLDSLPDDEIDGMMQAHIMATHLFAMTCFKSVNRTPGDDRIRMQFLSQAGRLIALHGRQVEKLEQRRESRRFLAEQAARQTAAAAREAEWQRKEAEFQAALSAATAAERSAGA